MEMVKMKNKLQKVVNSVISLETVQNNPKKPKIKWLKFQKLSEIPLNISKISRMY